MKLIYWRCICLCLLSESPQTQFDNPNEEVMISEDPDLFAVISTYQIVGGDREVGRESCFGNPLVCVIKMKWCFPF